jgi:hypothetical protein
LNDQGTDEHGAQRPGVGEHVEPAAHLVDVVGRERPVAVVREALPQLGREAEAPGRRSPAAARSAHPRAASAVAGR